MIFQKNIFKILLILLAFHEVIFYRNKCESKIFFKREKNLFFPNKFVAGESITAEEQEELINHALLQYIKRFEIINSQTEGNFSSEFRALIGGFSRILYNADFPEKQHFYEHFFETLLQDFYEFLQQALLKQEFNENILMANAYIKSMFKGLHAINLSQEALAMQQKLLDIHRLTDLKEKRMKYNELLDNLSPDFKHLLDQQPPNELLLKAHLKFLLHFLVYVSVSSDESAYLPEFGELGDKLFTALRGSLSDKLICLQAFSDDSTKFGRMLQQRLIEYKINYYGH